MTYWFSETPRFSRSLARLQHPETRVLGAQPANFFWKTRTGAERWHAAMRDVHASITVVDVFRTRSQNG